MEKQNEKNLLNIIKIVPILVLILFSISTTYLMIHYNDKQLQKEIKELKNDFINLQKEVIHKEVNKIHAMINYEYKYLKNRISKTDILNNIESMQYDQNGYIFIIDYQGNFLINISKSFMETNQLDLKDKNGFMITKEIIKIAKDGEGYISYLGLEGTHRNQSKKISFVKGFDSWNWAIGYGFHPSDIEPKILKRKLELQALNGEKIKNILIINTFLTLIFILFFMLFSKSIKNRFNTYKKELQRTEAKNREKDEIIFHQSKMATIGELLNIISHQWRQPLAQINSLTLDMYIDQKQNKLSDEGLKKSITDIEKTTKYLSNTIDDFSNFFIQDRDKKEFSPQEAIQECISILSPSLKDIDVQIKGINDISIYGYVTLYQQVILTIIINSLDAFFVQNIEDPKIIITIDQKENKSYVTILDNAKGIDVKNIDKIFDLYFSTKESQKVTGLGLYIAKQIIQKSMNGTIKAKNLDDGVAFIIEV